MFNQSIQSADRILLCAVGGAIVGCAGTTVFIAFGSFIMYIFLDCNWTTQNYNSILYNCTNPSGGNYCGPYQCGNNTAAFNEGLHQAHIDFGNTLNEMFREAEPVMTIVGAGLGFLAGVLLELRRYISMQTSLPVAPSAIDNNANLPQAQAPLLAQVNGPANNQQPNRYRTIFAVHNDAADVDAAEPANDNNANNAPANI